MTLILIALLVIIGMLIFNYIIPIDIQIGSYIVETWVHAWWPKFVFLFWFVVTVLKSIFKNVTVFYALIVTFVADCLTLIGNILIDPNEVIPYIPLLFLFHTIPSLIAALIGVGIIKIVNFIGEKK